MNDPSQDEPLPRVMTDLGWEPTAHLRWGRIVDRVPFIVRGSYPNETFRELQQLWRRIGTDETRWEPVEMQP